MNIKGTSLAGSTSTERIGDDSFAGGPVRLVGELKKTKKKEKKKERKRHLKQWQTDYSSRPHTSSDQNQTLHGGWPAVLVIHIKCHPNRLRGYGAVGSKMALT